MITGPYAPYILGAYGVTAMVLVAVTVATWLRYRRAQAVLQLIEQAGRSRKR